MIASTYIGRSLAMFVMLFLLIACSAPIQEYEDTTPEFRLE